jgi:hypothetical protein
MNVFDLPVHPAAAMFPMVSDDELDELAADIKANGLLHPIVISDGQIIDGRNRREACRRAGIAKPQTEDLNGHDPIAYIVSANINRRNLTKGQRAMALAKLYPVPAKGGRGKKSELSSEFSSRYLGEARTVLACLPEAADAVLAGTKPLSEAYAEAIKARESLDSEARRLDRLRERAPDLADLVDDARMRLTEAESAYETRLEDARRQRHVVLQLLDDMEHLSGALDEGSRRDHIIETLRQPEDQQRAREVFARWHRNLTDALEVLK